MKVLEFKSISKADGYIYYINRYKATAVIEYLSKQESFPFTFSIEYSPLGGKTVGLADIPTTLDYPLLPVRKALKAFVLQLETENKLP